MVLLDVVLRAPATAAQINAAMQKASQEKLKDILVYNTEPLVSVDFNHTSASCTFDATQTAVVDEGLVHVVGWYDNEWGFACRMLDTAALLGSL
jgi:glyceraldehyde 3-phosphate dehydrogenase